MNTMAGKKVSAFTLIAVMLIAVTGAPASAQAADAKQPSVENPHMHLWGTDNIGQCWTHFDANETTSAVEGYGEKEFAENQQVDVNFNCAMSESFKATCISTRMARSELMWACTSHQGIAPIQQNVRSCEYLS